MNAQLIKSWLSGLPQFVRFWDDGGEPPIVVYPEISATTSASSTSAVSATVTTDTAGGTIYGVLSESATEMEAADIKSGADDSAEVTDADDDYVLDKTGLDTWTQYYWHIVHEDADGLMSNVLTIPVRTLDISIPLAFPDTAPATLLGVQVWSKIPKKADVEGLYGA